GRIVQRRGAHVDGDVQAQSVAIPAAFPAAGLLEHAVGEVLGIALALEQRHEMAGPYHLAVAAAQARQRLDRHHPAVAELDLGLEPGDELAAQHRRAHLVQGDVDRFVVVMELQAGVVGFEQRLQLLGGERLLDAAEHAHAVGAGHGLHGIEHRRIERADQGDGTRQPALRHVADELDPVHARHVQVHQEDIGRLRQLPQYLQRRCAVGGLEAGPDPRFRQQAQRHPALEPVVLHDHHPQVRQAHPASPAVPLTHAIHAGPAYRSTLQFGMTILADPDYTLDHKYSRESGQIYLSGVQALVRLPLMQKLRDTAAGLDTAGLVSGYRGSPLGGFDLELWRARKHLESAGVKFTPGLNEDLGATMVWGTQQVGLFPGAKHDGVFGMWYGKGPGVDRCGDVFKHANAAGTAKH